MSKQLDTEVQGNFFKTTITEVYETPHDKEAGIPPLFKYQTEVFDIADGVVIENIQVNYKKSDDL